MTEIKICGIKNQQDVAILNEVPVSYAGFVLFEKSKRFVTAGKAKELFEKLNPDIRKVAVTVSPDADLLKEIEAAGFDILQVHGELSDTVAEACRLPIWRAMNLSGSKDFEKERLKNMEKLEAVLADAKDYGSGKTFDWGVAEEESCQSFRNMLKERKMKFILAGGLNAENAAEGIRIFAPDIVDVSSGVEGTDGKDRERVWAFIRAVMQCEKQSGG